MAGELLNYFFNNLDKFELSDKEADKVQREKRLMSKAESFNYIFNIFYATLQTVGSNEKKHLFSISENTVVLINDNHYFHIQIYDSATRKPMFLIKSYRPNTDFNIHSYKNHALTITNHLIDRYMQYFKRFISWRDKHIHKEEFEKELMIKLKNGKTLFSKELTDTIYMVVDDMYFVMKKRGKNTISLLTMRPYSKISELPRGLKRCIRNSKEYLEVRKCLCCQESLNYVSSSSKRKYVCSNVGFASAHHKCIQTQFGNDFDIDKFIERGEDYVNEFKESPTYKNKKLAYQKTNSQRVNFYVQHTDCESCLQPVANTEYYTAIHTGKVIHSECAKEILDIKSTENIFKHSGLKGLICTKKQMDNQLTLNEENVS